MRGKFRRPRRGSLTVQEVTLLGAAPAWREPLGKGSAKGTGTDTEGCRCLPSLGLSRQKLPGQVPTSLGL